MFRLSTSCRVAEAQTFRPCGQCTRHWCIGTILNSLPPKDRCILLVSREPLLVFEFEASLFALQYTKPLFEFVLLPERRTQRPRGLSTCLKCKCKGTKYLSYLRTLHLTFSIFSIIVLTRAERNSFSYAECSRKSPWQKKSSRLRGFSGE